MQYVVIAHDGTDADALSRRMAVREQHLSRCDRLQAAGQLLFATALVDESGTLHGSIMVFNVADREALDAILEGEPYISGDVWRDITIQPCRVGPSFMADPASRG